MITPNKFISFDESVLSKLETLLNVGSDEIEIGRLYKETYKKFEGVDQFIYAIDILYVLGRIEVDFATRTVKYVKRNSL